MTEKLSKSLQHRVKNATVRMCGPTGEEGQGVYLGEEMILTAAHCLKSLNIWKPTIAPGEKYIESLKTHDGKKLEMMVRSADVVKDVAVLIPWEEADDDAFGDFCDNTEPLPLCSDDFLKEYAGANTDDGGFREFRIHVFTHEDEFTTGKASICSPCSDNISSKVPIKGGTSGGPIVNDNGELVGIVSQGKEDGYGLGSPQPIPSLTLPVWAMKRLPDPED
ncbi:MAG: trypsin-like peptidase domain-containing protein [Opitutae bacterium]|nr:trypsin-like peptidase domain-containing protein [Opitutae bacterium]